MTITSELRDALSTETLHFFQDSVGFDDFGSSLWDSVLGYYRPQSELKPDYPPNLLSPIGVVLSDEWRILKNPIFNEFVQSLFEDIIPSEHHADFLKLCASNSIGIPELGTSDINKDNLVLMNPEWTWNDLADELKYENRFHCKSVNEKLLEKYFHHCIRVLPKGSAFYRVRVMDVKRDAAYPLSEMGSPPKEKARAGRMNPEGISYLYLASDEKTAVAEVRASLRDYVTIACYTATKELKLLDFRKLVNITPFEVESLLPLAANKSLFKQLASAISMPMRRFDNLIEYVPTQYMAEFIKSLESDDGNTLLVDGIQYESTMNPNGINYMLFSSDGVQGMDSTVKKEVVNIIYKLQ